MQPPIAKKIPVITTYHETRQLTDDYAWLRQSNWKEMFKDTALLSADIREYLEAENDYTEKQFFQPEKQLIDELIAEMKERTEICYDSAGVIDGPYKYFTRYSEADYPVFLRTEIATGREDVLLDVNTELAGEGKKVFLRKAEHSPDHKSFAVLVDYSGSENYTVLIKDLATGKFLADDVVGTGNMEWGKDSAEFFYTRFCDDPEKFYHDRVFMHRVGTSQNDDRLIYQEPDQSYYLEMEKTSSGRFVTVVLNNKDVHERHVVDLQSDDYDLKLIAGREHGLLYDIDHGGDVFFIRHNGNGAIGYQISTTSVETPSPEFWQDFIPHNPGHELRQHKVFADHLVHIETKAFMPSVVVTRLDNKESHAISFDDPAYHVVIDSAEGFNSQKLRLNYTSPRTPVQYYNYDMNTRERELVRQEQISGHQVDDYIVERIFIPTHDGVDMPLTITRHKETVLDSSAPLLLYGYGSYGTVMPATFARMNYRYSLIDRGFIFVDAHIRGGGEMGHEWYLDGKMMNKKNTFKDFITAGEWLVSKQYTQQGKIAIEGRSAGGLLMGAVTNMAPEGLFGCVVAGVPFVDLMHTMLDTELPLTPPEWIEWGNPIEDEKAFDYMLSYSPYDNVEAKNYPPMLIVGGLTDPRVTYWEPAKWAAKLRANKTDTNPLYLHIAMDSGHGGDPGRFSHLPERAQAAAFMLKMS